MAIQGSLGLADVSSSVNQSFERSSTRTYYAYFDQSDDEYAVILGCGLAIYQAHPSDSVQRITSLDFKLGKAKTSNPETGSACDWWIITANYGPWNPLEYPANGNPISLPVRYRIDFTTAEVAAFEDVDGNPIVNSAGVPFDPGLTREVTRATLTVRRNEAPGSVSLPTLAALSNTLNVAAWNGFPAKTVKLNPVKLPEIQYSQATNTFYFPFEYVFDINFDTWVKQVINAGFTQLDGDGNLVPIYINGQPAQEPVPLDEEGHAILNPSFVDSGGDSPPDTDSGGTTSDPAGGGEPPEGGTGVASTSNLVILAFDLIRTADFTLLNMDNVFTLPSL